MDDQLQQLIELQKEQNQLFKRYLWRLRFSLMGLLLLTTATAIGLRFVVYQTRPKVITPVFTPAPPTYFPPIRQSTPRGDIYILPATPGTTKIVPSDTRILIVSRIAC
jgi:hypothetical protein